MLPFNFGPVELILILIIVAMLFGVGKLPEVFGAVGKGIREFRKESGIEGQKGAQAEKQANDTPAVTGDTSTPRTHKSVVIDLGDREAGRLASSVVSRSHCQALLKFNQ